METKAVPQIENQLLPIELLIEVARHLDVKALLEIAKVNKFFYNAATDNSVWNLKLCELGVRNLPMEAGNNSYKKIYGFLKKYPELVDVNKYVNHLLEDQQKSLTTKFVSHLKSTLIIQLRTYVVKDRCQGTNQLKGIYKLKNIVQSIFSGFIGRFISSYNPVHLSEEQKKDLHFFNKGSTEVARAEDYFSTWREINQISDLQSAKELEKKLKQRLDKTQEGNLRKQLNKCYTELTRLNSSHEVELQKIKSTSKEKNKHIVSLVDAAVEKALTHTEEEKQDLAAYRNSKQQLDDYKRNRAGLISHRGEVARGIGASGLYQVCIHKNLGSAMKKCTNGIAQSEEDIEYLYKRNHALFKEYDSISESIFTPEGKLAWLKKKDEVLYYQTLSRM